MTTTFLLLSPCPLSSPLPSPQRRLSPAVEPRHRIFFSRARCRLARASSASRSKPHEDFISTVFRDNPTQIEPRVLVGDRMMKQSERAFTRRLRDFLFGNPEAKKQDAAEKQPVHLKDILREFRGQLYVPEEVFNSEGVEFRSILERLPRMTALDFFDRVRTSQVEALTFVTPPSLPAAWLWVVVDLKETPGIKSLHQTRWAVHLRSGQLRRVLEDCKCIQNEIGRHKFYVGKLLEYPSPGASSVSSSLMVNFALLASVIATPAAVVVSLIIWALAIAAKPLFVFCLFVLWPMAKSMFISMLKILLTSVSKNAQIIGEYIYDIATEAFIDVRSIYLHPELVSSGSSTPNSIALLLFLLTIIVLFFRFALSRKPKDFRKWDIWQGIEFSQSKARARVDGSTGVLFSDVAGIDEAVEELQELVEYLKNPELFDEKGIKPPHGVLLHGPPGCGKTLVAKAIAGEAGVPFYQMAGSEFIEVLVGVGSSRIRDLFARAKVNKPAVVFIDEIDAVGSRRQGYLDEGFFNGAQENSYNAAVQERETTLNQLLIELDGFDTGKGVIFLGATNRMDLLDAALLRPGRFDRKIKIRPPGAKGRLDILKVHASKVKVSPTVDLSTYAQNLTGWSGAQLAQLLQEAALVAVRNKHASILQMDLDDAVDRLTVGPKRVGIKLGLQGQSRRATTEAGITLTAHLLRRYEAAELEFCERISLNPRGERFAQTVFLRLDDEAYTLERKPQLLHRLQVLLGGRAAEEVIFGRNTSKASMDHLVDASWLAEKILTIWNLVNPMTIHGEPCPWRKTHKFTGPRLDFEGSLYADYGLTDAPINFDLDDQVARRAEELTNRMFIKTVSLLKRHQAALVKIIKVLLEHNEIKGNQIEYILDKYPMDTPATLVLEEQNPGSLPFFEGVGGERELVLSPPTGEEKLSLLN